MNTKTQSILPNSCERILRPIPCKCGHMQVRWMEDADSHGLFITHDRGESLIAMHHNGYSCHNLAERMLTGNLERVEQQALYITDCGGLAASMERIRYYTTEAATATT
jgi:hypothetical protein